MNEPSLRIKTMTDEALAKITKALLEAEPPSKNEAKASAEKILKQR